MDRHGHRLALPCDLLCDRFRSGVWENQVSRINKREDPLHETHQLNVNGLRACLTHALPTALPRWTPIFSRYRRPRCSPVRRILPRSYTEYTYSAEKKGLLRHGLLVQAGAAGRDHPGDRAGGADHEAGAHAGIPGLLSGELLHPQQPGRAEAAGLPHDLGGRLPRLPAGAGREKAGDPVRRPERSPHRNGHQERKDQPDERRLYRPGAGQDD